MAGRTAIGLDIGTSGVRAAELSLGKGSMTLEKFGQVALPHGAVRDGEVVDPTTVAAAIRELWTHTKFSSKKVVVGVANQRVIVRQVDLPWLPEDELKAALPLQVADLVPMPVDQAVLDFHAVEEFTTDDGARMLRGLLVAASRDMVMGMIEATKLAGLTVTQVDLSSFAVLRSLAQVDAMGFTSHSEALVDVGAKVTNIVVHENGVPRFVRILLLGGNDLTNAVAERMGISIEQAEAVKQELRPDALDSAPMERQAAARVLESAVANFVDEVRGSLDYFRASSANIELSRLVLTGGGSRLAGLPERLEASTRLPVVAGNAVAHLQVGKTGLSPEQLQFVEPLAVVPVGLAMGAVR